MTPKSLKNGFLGGLLAFGCVFSASAKTDVAKKGGDPLLQQVEQLIQQAKWAKAEILWRRLEGRVPDQQWYYNLALILTRQGKLEPAAAALEKALQVRQPEAQIWQALKQIRTAQVQQAYAQVFKDQPIKTPDMQWLQVMNLSKKPSPLQTVRQALAGWARAWSAQDVNAYLSFYAPGFRPTSGMSHRAWVKQRQVRLTRPKYIRVALSNVHITQLTPSRIETVFDQTYRSDRIRDKVRKRLLWQKTPDGWKIIQEVVLP